MLGGGKTPVSHPPPPNLPPAASSFMHAGMTTLLADCLFQRRIMRPSASTVDACHVGGYKSQ
eukprot:scaffold133848_cov45-Tisochrysis_lutea.AAC.1